MKENSAFNPDQQQKELSSKIVAGLERVSEVFKILLWEKAKLVGLSPIQIQILVFIAFHKEALCNVSHLAKEFNITKPTISDAIKILDKKELIVKVFSPIDNRRYNIQLSSLGTKMVSELHDFANPLESSLVGFKQTDLQQLFITLSELIYKLNKNGVLTVQRTCFGCRFYQKNEASNYCNFLEKELLDSDIRLDCPEFEER